MTEITVTTNNDGTYRLPSGADFAIYSYRDSVDVQVDVYGTPEADEMGGASTMVEIDTAAGAVDQTLYEAGIDDDAERAGMLALIASHFKAMGEEWDPEITYPFKRRIVGDAPTYCVRVEGMGFCHATGWEVCKSPDPADWWYEFVDRDGDTLLVQ